MVQPVLALLDGPFREQAYSAIESVYEVETDLTDSLAEPALEQLPAAVNTFIVKGDTTVMEAVLAEFFSENETRERIGTFFEDFATADAFQELRDVLNYVRSGENLQFYLYLCDLRFGTAAFPLFYIPANTRFDEEKAEYVLEFDPHLFINKQAVDWILQEQRAQAGRAPISPIADRIVYLSEEQRFCDQMQKLLHRLVPSLEITAEVDLTRTGLQAASSPFLKFSTAAYFAAFDKADEAVLNDYEALLTAVTADQQGAGMLFENIIRGLLMDDPVSVQSKVDDAWQGKPIPERLLAISPIPVNEEQQKILSALEQTEGRYLAIQGPPGTGKSHTITAIAFNCILKGQNILVLSDKGEALDVVEDKLNTALSAVRRGEDFPNPILRLGRNAGTYNRLLSQQSQGRIRQQHQAHKTNADQLDKETQSAREALRNSIEKTVRAYSGVRLQEIEDLQRIEAEIDSRVPGLTAALQAVHGAPALRQLEADLKALDAQNAGRNAFVATVSRICGNRTPVSLGDMLLAARIHAAAGKLATFHAKRPLSLFGGLRPSHHTVLTRFVLQYRAIRLPLFGYLFRGARVQAINRDLVAALPSCREPLSIHERLDDLASLISTLQVIGETVSAFRLEDPHGETVYGLLSRPDTIAKDVTTFHRFLESFCAVFKGSVRSPDPLGLADFLVKSARYACAYSHIHETMNSAPAFDFVGDKAKLETLYTSKMTFEIDGRFVDFVDNKKATAKSLGAVLKAKQQFPQAEFEHFKQAFPCVIAGIREFAEYVPLKTEIFDVVVIDEASQVSVAQAFPALLRAKKVVVFGDKLQFSNVKSAQASNAVNDAHLADIEAVFRQKVSNAADRIQRLKQFDVKKSVLEFFELISSYSEMLRKHFRGYQELISFSSKTFYGGQLQAIKVRGKPIEDVIRFTELTHDGRAERLRNTNSMEGETILQELKDLVDAETGISVGVITPFREQQQYLSKLLFNDAYGARFETDLKLKVMTFDTCQGEERDLIVYSMVATGTKDLLNYIFPVDLSVNVDPDKVEESLKYQRLNVGFSRAKETIWFVLSKPLDEFHGSIGRVLSHYRTLLEDKTQADPEDTDPASPMEAKVLDWVKKTPFFQKNQSRIELVAQFPIGDYLRQLDPFYQHPAYRCDFLLRFQGAGYRVNVILEYDGFAEHFIERKKVHEGNYDRHYRPEDIERQMVIESYGYKFLRLNRFNLGPDPIKTITERLYALTDAAPAESAPDTISRIKETAGALSDGEAKVCAKCGQVKPRSDFIDPELRGGTGGEGRNCMACKTSARKKPAIFGGRRSSWRRGRYGRY